MIQIELINHAGVSFDSNIGSDDVETWLAGLCPAETLNAGRLEPREIERFSFDCDELGLILRHVTRSRFVGNANDFGVIVSVNGRVTD